MSDGESEFTSEKVRTYSLLSPSRADFREKWIGISAKVSLEVASDFSSYGKYVSYRGRSDCSSGVAQL